MKNAVPFLLLLSCFLLTANSCKKGCTNSKASNYNKAAREDDASCLFCDSIVLDQYSATTQSTDFLNPGGSYYNQIVLNANANGNLCRYNGNNCKALGHTSNCNSGGSSINFANLHVQFENLVGDTLITSGTVQVFITSGSGQLKTITINQLQIPPYSKVTVEEALHFACIFSNFASCSVSFNVSELTYK